MVAGYSKINFALYAHCSIVLTKFPVQVLHDMKVTVGMHSNFLVL